MKKYIALIIASIVTISCGEETNKSTLEDLNAQHLVITKKIDSLTNELRALENEITKIDPNKKHPVVTAFTVKNEVFKHYIEIQGVVQADKNIEIRPELGGTVRSILVKEGQKVKAGQLLIQLDDVSIKNSIDELTTQLNLAKTTFERQERLWNQKIGSEMQYLQAKAQKESLENNLASLKTQANKMKVIAPFSGIVDEIFPKNGELTNPQMPVIRLINLDKVYVEAEITESYLPVIKIGTETVLNFPSINKEITSEIAQIGHYINPDNRSFKTRINISNKDQSIKPNLLADLKILDFEATGIKIPSNLVQQDQTGADYVFIIKNENGQNKIVKSLITITNEYQHNVFVTEGISENDVLANAGARLIKEGDIVEIRTN
ncbi:efflux RND transporter periplasmic adaptor subunit [Lutibacter sp. A80]|uniref:efflux RND transporter periplasmic adaptor subunit n=1 Tax=unclassified Lutibacter TaxID=2626258 RepID=UPI001F066E94|nr:MULTISPECIES: efflux RND transporter periplasmic adaptor subunit [unclassified Lutibacter]UMB53391.1 efflux RND transporter periplasmic adaptor subunit [Lutibacter sp. A64]UMB59975.1 efflux RND transporter periplasmic adaptor subunit [Lutibacter sp. A80]